MRFTIALIPLLTVPLFAQIAAEHIVVLTRAPAAQAMSTLLDVEPTTGTVRVLPRFPMDHLPPLAVAIDPVNGDVIVALDDLGLSRLTRLQFVGGQLVSIRSAGAVTGAVTAIAFGGGVDLITSSESLMAGALHRHTREINNPGSRTLITALANPTAMDAYGNYAYVVQSGSGQPVLSQIDLVSGNQNFGPMVIPGLSGRRITGVHDLPTGAIRHVLTDDAGQVHLFEFLSQVRTLPTTPALPAGAFAATRMFGLDLMAVGGAAHPWLISMPVFTGGAGLWTKIAGPLPGDPVGFAVVPPAGPKMIRFGESCSIGGKIFWSGQPKIGNAQFTVDVVGAAGNANALFVFGADDHFSGRVVLPIRVNGCLLHTAPDVVVPALTSATGHASMPIPIPNNSSLVGIKVFAQWFVGQGAAMGSSAAVAIWVGN